MTGLVPVIHAAPLQNTSEVGRCLTAWMPGTRPRLSGSILLAPAHGVDSNHFQSLATRLDMKRISAVPHTNTV
ncbi:MAG: hypothetical protein ACLPGW_13165, partial [Roseiarcus sp.]